MVSSNSGTSRIMRRQFPCHARQDLSRLSNVDSSHFVLSGPTPCKTDLSGPNSRL